MVRQLGMFPLSTVLYPFAPLSLHVFEPRYRALTADCLEQGREFGVVLINRGSEVGGGDRREVVGTVARIETASPLPDGRWVLVARGTERFTVAQWLGEDPYPLAEIEMTPPERAEDGTEAVARALAAVRRARGLLSELENSPALAADIELGGATSEVAWRLCAEAPLTLLDRQRLLVLDDPIRRLDLLADLSDELAEDLRALLAEGGAES